MPALLQDKLQMFAFLPHLAAFFHCCSPHNEFGQGISHPEGCQPFQLKRSLQRQISDFHFTIRSSYGNKVFRHQHSCGVFI
ncbi:hypothetical protein D3C80_1681290 [compost metagenome]